MTHARVPGIISFPGTPLTFQDGGALAGIVDSKVNTVYFSIKM